MPNHTNGRPDRLFMTIHGKRTLTPAYRQYLRSFIQLTEDEEKELLELAICLTGESIERIEDFSGTATFIEGDRA